MKILPAIDLKDGQCVRLQKGDYGTAHKVAEDAVQTARGFLAAGAGLIHMVDLDGAKDGSHANYDVVKRVIEQTGASGTVRTDGWLSDSGEDYLDFAKKMEQFGVKTIIFTDIDKDGMLEGPNFDQLGALRQAVSCAIVASGGVTTLDDIRRLRDAGIDAAIAGKAIYTGALDLAEAIKEAR